MMNRGRAPWAAARAASTQRHRQSPADANPFALLSGTSRQAAPVTSLRRRRRKKGRKRPRPESLEPAHAAADVLGDDAGDVELIAAQVELEHEQEDDSADDPTVTEEDGGAALAEGNSGVSDNDAEEDDDDEEASGGRGEQESTATPPKSLVESPPSGKLDHSTNDADTTGVQTAVARIEPARTRAAVAEKVVAKRVVSGDQETLAKQWAWTPRSVVATEEAIVLMMQEGQRAPFVGSAMVRVLRGAVDVLGYPLRPRRGGIDVHCPLWLALPAPTALPSFQWHTDAVGKEDDNDYVNDNNHDDRRMLDENPGLPESAWERVLKIANKDKACTVVLFRPIKSELRQSEGFASASLDGDHYRALVKKHGMSSAHFHVPGFSSTVNPARLRNTALPDLHIPIFVPSDALRLVARDLSKALQERERTPVVLVAGAKGAGKSTSTRYLCNALLGRGAEEIVHLDLDPGQPEFTPAGLLSCHVLSAPLGHPPHVNVFHGAHAIWDAAAALESKSAGNGSPSPMPLRARRVIFYGGLSPKTDPLAYTACASEVARTLQGEPYRGRPVVINCFGWIKGLGADLLQAIVELFQPSHVLKIVGNSTARSFDVIPPPGTKVYAASWRPRDGVEGQRPVTPSDLRKLRLVAYFCGSLPGLSEGERQFLGAHTRGRSALKHLFGPAVSFARNPQLPLPSMATGPSVAAGAIVDPAKCIPALLETAEAVDIPLRALVFGMGVGWTSGWTSGDGEANSSGLGFDVSVDQIPAAMEHCLVALAFAPMVSEDCGNQGKDGEAAVRPPINSAPINSAPINSAPTGELSLQATFRYVSVPAMDSRQYNLLARQADVASLTVAGLAFVKSFDNARGTMRVVAGSPLRRAVLDALDALGAEASQQEHPRIAVLRGQVDFPKEMLQSSAHSCTRHVSWEVVGGPAMGVMRSRNNILRKAR